MLRRVWSASIGIMSIALAASLIGFATAPASGDDTVGLNDGIGPGGTARCHVHAVTGDLVHAEWNNSIPVQFEFSYETDIENYVSHEVTLASGCDAKGNITLQSSINGTYSLSFTNDANETLWLDATLSVESEHSAANPNLIYAAVIVVAAGALISLAFFLGRSSRGRRQKGA